MLKAQSAFTPLNAYSAPSNLFTLDLISPQTAVNAIERDTGAHKDIAGSGAKLNEMPEYDCFDNGKGHFASANYLFDKGVWIGYLAKESRNTRYRQLPSFSELESNYDNMSLPHPPEVFGISELIERDAVCRGCFGEHSQILNLQEIRFSKQKKKLAIMPLEGADDAGLFCILVQLRSDRSVKALQQFRLYEHETGNDVRSFENRFVLLAARDQEKDKGVMHLVRNTLPPQELARNAVRSGNCRSDPNFSENAGSMPTVEKTAQQGSLPKILKRKQQAPGDDYSEVRSSVKRVRTKALTGPRMSTTPTVQLSDDDIAEPLRLPHERRLTSQVRGQQLSPVSPSTAPAPLPIQMPAPREVPVMLNNVPRSPPDAAPTPPAVDVRRSGFTDDQSERIEFIWNIDFEGREHEVRRVLSDASTFGVLLEKLRKDMEHIPSAMRQMKTNTWSVSYQLANGEGKASLISLNSRPEVSFNALLRHISQRDAWKTDVGLIVEVEIKASLAGIID